MKKDEFKKIYINRNMAWGKPTVYGNRIKNTHPDIFPLYNAFKAAMVKGTSRVPCYAVTEDEQQLFEHILFNMDYDALSLSERIDYVSSMARRSELHRENKKRFSIYKYKMNLKRMYEIQTNTKGRGGIDFNTGEEK